MGSAFAALLKIVEQCEPACIIGVSSPGPGEDVSCTDSNQRRNVLFRLNAPTQSDLCQKRSVASNYPPLGK